MQVTTMALRRLASTTPRWVAASSWSWFSSALTTPSLVTTSSPWPSPSPPQNNTSLQQVCCHGNNSNWSCTLKVKVKGQRCSPVIYCWYTKNLVFLLSFPPAFLSPPSLPPLLLLSLLPPPSRPGNPGGAAGTCPWLLHSRLLCRWNCRGIAGD